MPTQIATPFDRSPVDGSDFAIPAAGLLRTGGLRRAGRSMLAFAEYGMARPLPFQSHIGHTHARVVKAVAGVAAPSAVGIAMTATGTNTLAASANTSYYTQLPKTEYLVTTAATTAVAGVRSSQAEFWRGNAAGQGGFYFNAVWGPATGPSTTAGTLRLFAGLVGATGAPTDVDPSTITQCIGMGCDSTDTQLQFMYHTGTAAITKVPIGSSLQFPKPSTDRFDVYMLELYCPPNDSYIGWRVTNLRSGAVAYGQANSNLPAASTFLNPRICASVGGTSSVVGVALMSMYIETPY